MLHIIIVSTTGNCVGWHWEEWKETFKYLVGDTVALYSISQSTRERRLSSTVWRIEERWASRLSGFPSSSNAGVRLGRLRGRIRTHLCPIIGNRSVVGKLGGWAPEKTRMEEVQASRMLEALPLPYACLRPSLHRLFKTDTAVGRRWCLPHHQTEEPAEGS